MSIKYFFFFLLLISMQSSAFFGLGGDDFCKKNPNDFLCSDIGQNITNQVDKFIKPSKKETTPTASSSTQNNKVIKIKPTQTKSNVSKTKPVIKKQPKYDFDNLYKQMNTDLYEVATKKIKKKYKKNDFIRNYCNSLKRFPSSWKEDFAKKNKINIKSIKFLGVTLTEGSYSPYCSVKSSSDRGVCKHWITFANQVPRISNECK